MYAGHISIHQDARTASCVDLRELICCEYCLESHASRHCLLVDHQTKRPEQVAQFASSDMPVATTSSYVSSDMQVATAKKVQAQVQQIEAPVTETAVVPFTKEEASRTSSSKKSASSRDRSGNR